MKKPRILDRLRVWLIVKLGGYVEQVQKVVRVEHMLPSGFEEVTLKSSLVIGDEELMAIVCHMKKHLFQGHELDKAHLAKELGDVAWYLAVAAYAIGYDLDTILKMNVDKLRKRYPDGFDPERSLHREAGDL